MKKCIVFVDDQKTRSEKSLDHSGDISRRDPHSTPGPFVVVVRAAAAHPRTQLVRLLLLLVVVAVVAVVAVAVVVVAATLNTPLSALVSVIK